jgi:hypothetical protein
MRQAFFSVPLVVGLLLLTARSETIAASHASILSGPLATLDIKAAEIEAVRG